MPLFLGGWFKTIELLKARAIDIYYIDAAGFGDEQDQVSIQILDQDELETYDAYLRTEKKREFLIGRFLVKSILAFQLGKRPENVVLKKASSGKLFFDDIPPQGGRIGFNLSHSKGVIACSFILDGDIGIDLEKIGKNLQAVVERFFHPQEIALLNRLDGNERNKMAYQIWTMKEAFVKAKGLHIAHHLRELNVLDCSELVFQTFELIPEYLMTIAIESAMKTYEVRIQSFFGDKVDAD